MKWLITIVLALAGGFAGAALWDVSGFGGQSTRDYLLANPEVLPEAMEALNRRQRLAQIAPVRAELELPFPGAVLGNPEGSITLVEFSDYACGYCRQSVADVERLVAENPDLRVVVREFPILRRRWPPRAQGDVCVSPESLCGRCDRPCRRDSCPYRPY
jgi:protein-disulfide isomerase